MDGSSPVLFEVGTGDKSSIAQLTVVRARFARRCHGRQRFLQGTGSPHQGQSADTMSSVEREYSWQDRDIELIDIPDHAGLYDFSELSRSSVNPSSTSVTHQEEDCALRMELAGQLVPGKPHYIAAADNEVLSSSHQGRQKDFEDQRGDLGNDNDHGNDDIVPPKGLPKGRGVNGSSKMSTGNALLLLDRKQNIMTLEST
ncbi:unnamed protein product [Sphagnum troendelagicum]